MIPMKIALHTCHKHYIHISYCNILFTSYSIYPHYHTCLLACFTWRFDNTIMLEVHMERMYVICMQHLCTCNNVHPPYVVHTPVAIPSDWLMSHFLHELTCASLIPQHGIFFGMNAYYGVGRCHVTSAQQHVGVKTMYCAYLACIVVQGLFSPQECRAISFPLFSYCSHCFHSKVARVTKRPRWPPDPTGSCLK